MDTSTTNSPVRNDAYSDRSQESRKPNPPPEKDVSAFNKAMGNSGTEKSSSNSQIQKSSAADKTEASDSLRQSGYSESKTEVGESRGQKEGSSVKDRSDKATDMSEGADGKGKSDSVADMVSKAADDINADDTDGKSKSEDADGKGKSDGADGKDKSEGADDKGKSDGAADPESGDMLSQILQLLKALTDDANGEEQTSSDSDKTAGKGGDAGGSGTGAGAGNGGFMPRGGSILGQGGGVSPVEGTGPGGSAPSGSGGSGGSGGGDSKIPKPTEHIQQLNLGGKTVTVGGDGTGNASAQEVADTAKSIEHMYQNSPTFKNMIDNSSDPSFEVSVGKRDDNTSWGSSDGRLFMNTNNIAPSNDDSWQSLLSHEFAHASIDLGHGGEMERLEEQAAREA